MEECKQYVAFMLGEEEYAVEILTVQEIIRWSKVSRVPKAPNYVKGVINLRGLVIPVIDSHIRFSLPEQVITEATRIIVFRHEDAVIGLTVDLVTEVLSLDEQNIEITQTVSGAENVFVKGIGKLKERLLIILDLSKVLDLNAALNSKVG